MKEPSNNEKRRETNPMNIYADLFLTFAKVGVMTFGGGYAMLPILQREVVDNKGWATEEELMDYFASLLAGVITAFSHLAWVSHAFGGIRVCVCILILNAVVKLLKKAVIDVPTAILFAAVALGSYFTPLSPVVFVVAAGAAGIVLRSLGVGK